MHPNFAKIVYCNNKTVCRTIAAIICVLFESLLFAGIRDFPAIGNEKHTAVDELTGKQLTFLTNSSYINTTNYMTCRTWAENEKYIIIESTRPRPDGTHNSGERQLIAADIETGDLFWLASITLEQNVTQYGKYHIEKSVDQYYTDYASATNSLLYLDITGHYIYLLNLNTKQTSVLWHVTEGTTCASPSISEDGTRAIIHVVHPGPGPSSLFYGRTYAVYALDIDTQNSSLKGKPRLITTFVSVNALDNQSNPTSVYLGHAQVNPANPDEFAFCHGYSGKADGSVLESRVWYAKTDGSLVKLATPTPKGRVHTHEIWGPQGKYIYFVDIWGSGNVSRVDPRTGDLQKLITSVNPRCLHISISGDENKIVWDTQSSGSDDHLENVVLFNVTKNKTTTLARQMAGIGHPRHMHPNVSRSGKYVAFTVAQGANSKVAFMNIGDPNL